MGYCYYLARPDNRTLFELGKGCLRSAFEAIPGARTDRGDRHWTTTLTLRPEYEPLLASKLEFEFSAWMGPDDDPAEYAREVAAKIVAWAGGQEVAHVGESHPWIDGDESPYVNPPAAGEACGELRITGSRYEPEAVSVPAPSPRALKKIWLVVWEKGYSEDREHGVLHWRASDGRAEADVQALRGAVAELNAWYQQWNAAHPAPEYPRCTSDLVLTDGGRIARNLIHPPETYKEALQKHRVAYTEHRKEQEAAITAYLVEHPALARVVHSGDFYGASRWDDPRFDVEAIEEGA